MKSKLFFTLALLPVLSLTSYAQRLQLGLGVAANNTFFHKGASVYEEAYHGGDLAPAGGIFMAAGLRLTEAWELRSGFGYHIRQYRVLTENFNIPGVEGYFYFDARFHCMEIPLVLAFRTPRPKAYKFEYRLGLVNSYYMPVQEGVGYRLEGSVPAEMGIYAYGEPSWEKTYSPDLFASVALIGNRNNIRRHEFALSYQYGLLTTAEFNYEAYIRTTGYDKTFTNVLRPTLSSFMLSYTFYPAWLNFGQDRPEEAAPVPGL